MTFNILVAKWLKNNWWHDKEEVIRAAKLLCDAEKEHPLIVVKGIHGYNIASKEHEHHFNPEQIVWDSTIEV